MSFSALLASARSRQGDPEALAELASQALEAGEEEAALPIVSRAATDAADARLWQWKGLLERALDEHEQALASFAEAARLAPEDASIARGHARVALEAGVPAEELFEKAIRLGPSAGSLLGLAAARLASGHGARAEAELEAALAASPAWVEGHFQLAQLRSLLGRPQDAAKSLERAVAQAPALWPSLFDLHLRAERFDALDQALERARSEGVPAAVLNSFEAVAAVELGQTERANRIFASLEASALPIWRIRHLLRSSRASEALSIIDEQLAGSNAMAAWPYASIAWKLTGDPRSEWLEGDGRLVSVIDLGSDLVSVDELARVLQPLHVAKAEYLDQSVRGGTQTDGPLLSRIDPAIRRLRAAIVAAVRAHVSQLPPIDDRHPTLRHPRDRRVRFSGSWSVRLRSGGSHANHVHPQGWISSALYLSLPAHAEGEPKDAGWLTLGEPDAQLGLPLQPRRKVEPEPGRLVLFPSWMWHGTIPFAQGERLAVAFDVAVPR